MACSKTKRKSQNDVKVWELNNVEIRRTVGGAVWRWGQSSVLGRCGMPVSTIERGEIGDWT